MRKLHLMTGILAIIIFLITGQFMRHHQPPMSSLTAAARLLFRSRHIYILAAGLVNLMLGLYLVPGALPWRRRIQAAGSVLILTSSALLTAAFLLEPERGFQPDLLWSSLGLYALFGGTMLHFLGVTRRLG
jgi:hypothetical protein